MRMLPVSLVASLLLASSIASLAHAQMGAMGGGAHSRILSFGVGGGVAVPVSDAKDALKNGWNGLAYARAQLPGMPFSFGVNVTFQQFDFKHTTVSTSGYGSTPESPNTSMLAGVGDVKIDLMKGMIQPYLLAGIGVYNVKADDTGGTSSTSDTNFGINGGAGIALRLSQLRLYVQGRVDNVYTSSTGAITAKSIQVVPVTVGLEY
jgi:opacity protein-like surface antigen